MVLIESVVSFATNPQKMLIVVSSLIAAMFCLMAWKKYNKTELLYAHLLFTLSPMFYFALSINCSLKFAGSFLSWCTLVFAKAIIYILPPTLALSFIAGAALIPKIYSRIGTQLKSRLFDSLVRKTGIKAKLFLLDSAKAVAFSTKNSVFVSVGMFETLTKNELEAVLLHELYHVQSRGAFSKFSSRFVQFFSPIAWFSAFSVESEEWKADAFAAHAQGTKKFLIGAKAKVE